MSMSYANVSFNQLLTDWDVSSVTKMDGIFHDANSFHQPLGDVGCEGPMHHIFAEAKHLYQLLGDWNV